MKIIGPLTHNSPLGLFFPVSSSIVSEVYPNSGTSTNFNSQENPGPPKCCVTGSNVLVNKTPAISSVWPYPSTISQDNEHLKKFKRLFFQNYCYIITLFIIDVIAKLLE